MKLSVAIPAFNEGKTLPLLLAELRRVLDTVDCEYEIIIIDDGSDDDEFSILAEEAAKDRRIKVLSLSRNFGQQAALTAGLDFCTGDAVVIMDADLQDPPDLLPEMVRLFEQGYDVVSPQRISRDGETWFKRKMASLFYGVMRKLAGESVRAEVGDFRLLSRSAVMALRQFREQHRFVRGIIAWLGLKEAFLPFHRRSRAAGSTKYSLWRMFRLSWVAITSFSALPLRLSIIGGLGASGIAVLYFLYTAYVALIRKTVVPGWTSIIFVQCFFFGVTLLSLGIIGQYIAHIYDEAKSRPLYVLAEALNIDPESVPAVDRAVVLTRRPGTKQTTGD